MSRFSCCGSVRGPHEVNANLLAYAARDRYSARVIDPAGVSVPTHSAYRALAAGALWLLVVGCSTAASQTPLANSDPVGSDIYFYGPHGHGGKASIAHGDTVEVPVVNLTHVASAPTLRAAPPPVEIVAATSSSAPSAQLNPERLSFAGRYSGTDTVTILFADFPDEPQVDESAKIDVKDVTDQRISITVVDSNQGTPLCTIEGKNDAGKVSFDPGQPCFEAILGIPAESSIVNGTGLFSGEQLTLDFEVALEVDVAGSSLEGSIDYHFDGKKSAAP